ncbi:MAG: Eco57I restriction-modification methylase domain-containing protein, partial [Clostridia bacterium]
MLLLGNLIDIDSALIRSILPLLLEDKTAHRNIIWATDTYESLGESYSPNHEMTSHLVSSMDSLAIQPRTAKTMDDQQARTKKHAEVFTPAWICTKMINHCDAVWFGREEVFNQESVTDWTPTNDMIVFPKRKKWQHYVDSRRLEITCGEAPYLVSRYDASTGDMIPFEHRIGLLDRKLRIVNENTADEAEWLKWVMRAFQSTYGYEFQGDSLLLARINLLMTFVEATQQRWHRDPTANALRKAAGIISWNMWQMDGLKGTAPFGTLTEAYQQVSFWELFGEESEKHSPKCRFMDWRGDSSIQYNGRITRKGKEMKFDFVIGNPPYQDETVGDQKNYAAPVFHRFMDASYEVGKASELIHPGRFLFNAGSTPKAWNEERLHDPHFTVLYFEQDSSKVFSGTDIKGGVAITYRDRNRDYGEIGTFSVYPELNSILHKVWRHKDVKSLSDVCYAPESYKFTDAMHLDYPNIEAMLSNGHKYDFKSNVIDKLKGIVFWEHLPAAVAEYAQIFGLFEKKRVTYYIKRKYISAPANFDKYKIFIPKANGSGVLGEILSTPMIAAPGLGHTQTFMSIGNFTTEVEAQNLLKYVRTKFCRIMLGVLKITQDNPSSKWRHVPLQDFSPSSYINWAASISDIGKQLYMKYGLSPEEIAFIES